jgi:glycosyltransferase involved in cell wall biosynthesis
MGRLVPVKGLEFYLQAARLILDRRDDVTFVIVGDGPLGPELRTLAREYGIDGRIRFLGQRRDAHQMLELMDLFVLPSLSEGVPMVLLEALALGRPVVATRVGGVPEVIEHGKSGLLVSPGQPEPLADACMVLLDDRALARELALAGHQRVREHFSANAMAQQVATLYRSLVGLGATGLGGREFSPHRHLGRPHPA